MAVGSLPRLLAITPPSGPVDPELVSVWLAAGVLHPGLAVVLREPGRSPAALLDADGRLAAIRLKCQNAGIPLLVSCDVPLLSETVASLATTGIAGIQLRGDPAPHHLAQARALLGRSWLGRSCHGAPQPGDAYVDFTVLAPIFSPSTGGVGKTPVGTAALRDWAASPAARVIALGGIDPRSAAACLTAGAHGLAGIGVFFGAHERVLEDVTALCTVLRAHGRHDGA